MRSGTLLIVGGLVILGSSDLAAQSFIRAQAPTDRAAVLPVQQIDMEMDGMEAVDAPVARLLEGGTHNVNIRHEEKVTRENSRSELHDDFVDVWVIRRGGGLLMTGGRIVDGQHVDGVERLVTEGDVIFIPNGIPHGFKEAESVTWLNIRYIYQKD